MWRDSKIGHYRSWLWFGYVALDLAVLLYPTTYYFGFSQIESVYVIPNPLLFSVIFTSWLIVFVLISFVRSDLNAFHKIFLIISFSITSSLLTYKIAPLGLSDNYAIDITLSSYIGRAGHFPIPPPQYLYYFSYPGLMLLTYSAKSVLGISYAAATEIIQSVLYAILGLSIYLLSTFIIKNKRVALLAVPVLFTLSLQSQTIILTSPWTMGISLFTLSLVLIFNRFTRASAQVALLILSVAMIITHFFDPVDLLFVLIALSIASKVIGTRGRFTRFLIIVLVAEIAYFSVAAVLYFKSLLLLVSESFAKLISHFSIGYEANLASVNTFQVPWWVVSTRYFDLISISILGISIAFLIVVRIKRKQERLIVLYSAATLGITLFGALSFLASINTGGPNLLIGPQDVVFLTIPLILYYASKRKLLLMLFVIALLLFAAPTQFGLKYSQIATVTIYPSELVEGTFFAYHVPNLNVPIYTDAYTYDAIGPSDPFVVFTQYPALILNLTYDPTAYNIVNMLYFRAQLHLYGFSINDSIIYGNNIVYDNGNTFIIPPS